MLVRPAVLVIILAITGLVQSGFAQSTAFTYQGELKSGGVPANGVYDLRFRVFSTSTGGNQFLPETCVNNVMVIDGKFTATINVPGVFNAWADRFLEVLVRADTGLDCNNITGFTTLTPRQAITPAPFAQRANAAGSLTAPDGTSNATIVLSGAGASAVGVAGMPETPLVVLTSSVQTRPGEAVRVQNSDSGAAGQGYIAFGESGTSRTGFVGDSSAANTDIVLGADLGSVALSTQAGRVVNVTSSGRVGIGTTSPETPLHLLAPNSGITPGEGLRIQGNVTGVTNLAYASFANGGGTVVGYVGDGSTGDNTIFLSSSLGDVCLNPGSRVLTATAAGNVGIGTTTPTAKLDVRGDVILGSSGQFYAVKSPMNDRIIRGVINGNGSIDTTRSSSGFTVTHSITGTYVINFSPAFIVPPVIVTTPQAACCKTHITQTQTTFATILVQNLSTGAASDAPFHFIVIGQ